MTRAESLAPCDRCGRPNLPEESGTCAACIDAEIGACEADETGGTESYLHSKALARLSVWASTIGQPGFYDAIEHGLAAVRAIREPISYCKNDCLSGRILVSRDWPGSGRMADPVEEDCQACNATRSKSQARLAVRAALDAIGIHGAL